MRDFYVKSALLMCACLFSSWLMAQVTPTSQMERLTRGVVVVPSASSGYFVTWRMFGTDADNTSFDVLRNGFRIATSISNATCYNDAGGTLTSKYQIVTRRAGVAVDTTDAVTPWTSIYKSIKIDKPAGGTAVNSTYTYTPNDCSAADVDGDGEYEIILKWDPSNSKDNANSGYTGDVIIDCYKLDGTKLWRVNLGPNIRAGAHYTQFMVYDFDGDGKAEMICKTAPGSVDGVGNYVSAAATDPTITSTDNTKVYRNTSGYILSGPEYLTVFNGETGKAVNTIYYNPNRGFGVGGSATYGAWGDTYGNRGDRFLACVAYLDGPDKNPSAVMCRGYYTRSYLWAVNFDGSHLSTKWLHASVSISEVDVTDASGKVTKTIYKSNTCKDGNNYTAYGQGAHNLSVADVDGDGCDEITYGSAAIDNDGSLLYSTGLCHGDAQHLSDLDPDRPGLEFFMVHEDKISNQTMYGCDLRDARTGEILYHENGSGDTGRGMAADIDANHRGFEFWTSDKNKVMDIHGDSISQYNPSYDFRIYWDGDLQDELLGDISNHNSPYLEKWNGNGTSRILCNGQNIYSINASKTCNSTKGTPNLTADLFGDWREEMVFWCGTDSCHLNIFTTNIPTSYRFPTLMHDHVYRMGIAWQNVAYNQPPHLGYYLPDAIFTHFNLATNSSLIQTVNLGDSIKPISSDYVHCNTVLVNESVLPDGTKLSYKTPDGFTFTNSISAKNWTLTGKPEMAGDYTIVIKSSGDLSGKSLSDTLAIKVVDVAAVKSVPENRWISIGNHTIDDQIHIQFNLPRKERVDVALYDMSGKTVYKENFNIEPGMSLNVSGFSSLAKGTYIIKVQSAEGKFSMKMMK
jgi:rhamnogalacturonan endolyase